MSYEPFDTNKSTFGWQNSKFDHVKGRNLQNQTDGGTDPFVFLGIFTGPYLEVDQKRHAYCMLTIMTKCVEKLTKICKEHFFLWL